MANTRKPIKRKKINRRVVRQTPDPTKIDAHYIALHECYKAARKAGFTPDSIALMHVLIFGIIPPVIVPSSMPYYYCRLHISAYRSSTRCSNLVS